MSTRVSITDVGPRDGLQNEPGVISVADKIDLVDRLATAGLMEIEVSGFVSPKWVPQLADAGEVFKGINRRQDVMYSALVPNEQGMARALTAGVNKVSVFTAASETFCRRNINTDFAGSLERFKPVIEQATAAGIPVRAYVSCAVACPYDGPILPSRVREVVDQLLALGELEIDLGDTIGVATPDDMEPLIGAMNGVCDVDALVMHLHDTNGRAAEVAQRCLDLGIRRFDASVGGLGGCPFAPGASGNVSTEALVRVCAEQGFETGIDRDALSEIGRWIRTRTTCADHP